MGQCTSENCGNKFIGRARKRLSDLGGLIIEVETRNTRQEAHEEVRRRFNGMMRKEALKELKAEGCSVWKKRKARENVEIGDSIPT